MKKEHDLNYIAKVEKAIKEKYGPEAITNPKSGWDEEKEKKYSEELKKFYSNKKEKTEKIKKEDFYVSEKLTKRAEKTCPVCGSFSFNLKDDLYMNKFDCCFNCYIQYVEGREARWHSGWRPKN